ncbi:MAG: hypothetical protein HUN04_10540 [Desulfobacter sp.]|nr:MAG: hypothetical protein HUN04_10540 [Desulfobacter sp.]
MVKYDLEHNTRENRRRKSRPTKFRDRYDEAFTDEDLEEMVSRKKRKKKTRREKHSHPDWPEL